MNNSKKLKIVAAILAVVVVALLGCLGFAAWQISCWKAEDRQLAHSLGGLTASHDFQAGKLRLYVIAGMHDLPIYTGTNNGRFEIWYYPYFPEEPYPNRFSSQQEVLMYNSVMRLHEQNLHYHPSVTMTNIVSPTKLP